ncbi:MAG: SPOR domain-containing protein [Bacteroidales bacterium]
MRKSNLVILLVFFSFFLSGCDWVRFQLGMPTSREIEAKKSANLFIEEQRIKDSLLRLQIDSIAKASADTAALSQQVREMVRGAGAAVAGDVKEITKDVKEAAGKVINKTNSAVQPAISVKNNATAIPKADYNDRFYVIVGSFKDPLNSEKMFLYLSKNGYKPKLIEFKNGYKLVSAASFMTQEEATKEMLKIMDTDFAPEDIWVYDTNQRLHVK